MLSQHKHGTIEEFLKVTKAPLDHLFDNHRCCGEWCGVKKANVIELQYNNPMGYLCSNNDKELYKQLKEVTKKYVSASYLEQGRHPFNT